LSDPGLYESIVPPTDLGSARDVIKAQLKWWFDNVDEWALRIGSKEGPSLSMIADAGAKFVTQLVALEKLGDVEGGGGTGDEMEQFSGPAQ
jgi:hypothetical protein